jgi:hypothetical protein
MHSPSYPTPPQYPPPQHPDAAKQKRRRRTVLIVVCSVLVGCLCCTAAVLYAVFQPSSPRDVPISAPVVYDVPWIENEIASAIYSSVEASLAGNDSCEKESSLTRTSSELFRFEDYDAATVYFFGKNKSGKPGLLGYCFNKYDEKYSELLSIRFIPRDTSDFMMPANFVFQPEDEAAFYLCEFGLSVPGEYSRATDGEPLFIGVTQNEDIGRLRILGKQPTKILTCYDEGEKYYVWYYLGLDIHKALFDDPDFSFGDFTFGELIDVLDIRFEE